MSFVSVGETANFVGEDVPVDTDVGWPLAADLTQPYEASGSAWNGLYGWVLGSSAVQRSFLVQAGQTPAVALVVGLVSAQAMSTSVDLNFRGTYASYISPGSSTSVADGLANFHYQPLPPGEHA